MAVIERRAGPLELRAEGRVLVGPAIKYGDISLSHRERFERGAFALDGRTRWLNLRHDPEKALAWTGAGLTIEDRADGLHVRAELAAIPAADRALADVQAGRLTGFSVEFRALSERRDSGVRVIERADLDGVGLVGAPSYQQSTVELRARSGRTMRATIPSGRNVACRCSGAGCKFARISGEAMQEAFDDAFAEFKRETIAAFGSFDSPLASVSSGTLRGRILRNGDGQVEIDIPEGVAGTATVAAHEAAGLVVRPVIDTDGAVSALEGETRVYSRAPIRAFIASATDQRSGWPSPELIATPVELARADAPRIAVPDRRRIWL